MNSKLFQFLDVFTDVSTTEIIDPMVPFCDGALQTIYASQEGGWAGIIAEVLFGDVEIVDVVTTLVVSRVDAPW